MGFTAIIYMTNMMLPKLGQCKNQEDHPKSQKLPLDHSRVRRTGDSSRQGRGWHMLGAARSNQTDLINQKFIASISTTSRAKHSGSVNLISSLNQKALTAIQIH